MNTRFCPLTFFFFKYNNVYTQKNTHPKGTIRWIFTNLNLLALLESKARREQYYTPSILPHIPLQLLPPKYNHHID